MSAKWNQLFYTQIPGRDKNAQLELPWPVPQRGSCMVWEINMGVCPRLEFDNIMFSNCLGYDFYIYGAFEFLCNSIANL